MAFLKKIVKAVSGWVMINLSVDNNYFFRCEIDSNNTQMFQ